MHIHPCAHTPEVYAFVHASTHMCIRTCIHTHVHIHSEAYIHTSEAVHPHTYIHTYPHTPYTHPRDDTCIYTPEASTFAAGADVEVAIL